ncbi:MAG: hypothetical protein K1V95_01015 [Eubacterium sp.]
MHEKIKFLRQTLGLTEKEISSFLNVSFYKYISFEKAEMDVSCDIAILLSKLYGIHAEWMIYSCTSNNDLLYELQKQGLLNREKEYVLEKLKYNLFHNKDQKITYSAVKRVKDDILKNIAESITDLMRRRNRSVKEFAAYVGMKEKSVASILAQKRFIEIDELVRISKKTGCPINSMINKKHTPQL